MLNIVSRNVDSIKVSYSFDSCDDFIADWCSDDPQMGDNEILLVVWNDHVVYSSLGRKTDDYPDTVRTHDVYEWLLVDPCEGKLSSEGT